MWITKITMLYGQHTVLSKLKNKCQRYIDHLSKFHGRMNTCSTTIDLNRLNVMHKNKILYPDHLYNVIRDINSSCRWLFLNLMQLANDLPKNLFCLLTLIFYSRDSRSHTMMVEHCWEYKTGKPKSWYQR